MSIIHNPANPVERVLVAELRKTLLAFNCGLERTYNVVKLVRLEGTCDLVSLPETPEILDMCSMPRIYTGSEVQVECFLHMTALAGIFKAKICNDGGFLHIREIGSEIPVWEPLGYPIWEPTVDTDAAWGFL
jgi:hypothetical protein